MSFSISTESSLSPPDRRSPLRSARGSLLPVPLAAAAVLALSVTTAHAGDTDSPFATDLLEYDPGVNPAFGFTDPSTALGAPARTTVSPFGSDAVTPFQPAYSPLDIVSIGAGGSLVVAFDHDVLDDPRNPFGIDLLVFGNAFYVDLGGATAGGIVGEGGVIEVSPDGEVWTLVPDVVADGPFPTLGWLDADAYATEPGTIPSDFTRPVDPTIVAQGAGHEELALLYAGSGGGAGIDLAPLGLSAIRFVRVSVPDGSEASPEIDGFADVAPAGAPSPDLDGSGLVDGADLAIILGAWGSTDPAFDLDASGSVAGGDLAIVLGAFGTAGGAA